MQPPELTLVVAATRTMGIGAHGSMPWTGLRSEMRYFARVTARLPPRQPPPHAVNAVIMGRRTWDSIPARFRPLKDRLNIVVTRSAPPPPAQQSVPAPPPAAEPVRVPSFDDALAYVRARHADGAVARVFVIGGAQVYAAALAHPAARRLLVTALDRDFDCDTYFPLDLAPGSPDARGWARRSPDQLRQWTGETLDSLHNEENGTPYEFQMWEKEDP